MKTSLTLLLMDEVLVNAIHVSGKKEDKFTLHATKTNFKCNPIELTSGNDRVIMYVDDLSIAGLGSDKGQLLLYRYPVVSSDSHIKVNYKLI